MNRIAFVGAVDYSTLKPALDRKQQVTCDQSIATSILSLMYMYIHVLYMLDAVHAYMCNYSIYSGIIR